MRCRFFQRERGGEGAPSSIFDFAAPASACAHFWPPPRRKFHNYDAAPQLAADYCRDDTRIARTPQYGFLRAISDWDAHSGYFDFARWMSRRRRRIICYARHKHTESMHYSFRSAAGISL